VPELPPRNIPSIGWVNVSGLPESTSRALELARIRCKDCESSMMDCLRTETRVATASLPPSISRERSPRMLLSSPETERGSRSIRIDRLDCSLPSLGSDPWFDSSRGCSRMFPFPTLGDANPRQTGFRPLCSLASDSLQVPLSRVSENPAHSLLLILCPYYFQKHHPPA